jgi:hypothetical protein
VGGVEQLLDPRARNLGGKIFLNGAARLDCGERISERLILCPRCSQIPNWCASGIHPFLSRINNPPKVCDAAGSADSVVKIATEGLFENFRIADDLLAGREYFFDHNRRDAQKRVTRLLANSFTDFPRDRVSPRLPRHEYQIAEPRGRRQIRIRRRQIYLNDFFLGHLSLRNPSSSTFQ